VEEDATVEDYVTPCEAFTRQKPSSIHSARRESQRWASERDLHYERMRGRRLYCSRPTIEKPANYHYVAPYVRLLTSGISFKGEVPLLFLSSIIYGGQ
jgi:hypothetical protein